MTENMKKFLEAVSKNDELTAKINTMTKEELLALAKELGIELTDADFEKPAGELSDDELDTVAGGEVCYCLIGGTGYDTFDNEKTCVCVVGGGGEYKDGDCRCWCVGSGGGDPGSWKK